jgi:hypothetical protein
VRAAGEAGRDPTKITPAVMATIHVGEPASSQLALEPYVSEFYRYPLASVSSIQACRAGSAEDVVAYLRAVWEPGGRAFVLRAASLGAPEQQLDDLADIAIPAVSTWSDQTTAPPPCVGGPIPATGPEGPRREHDLSETGARRSRNNQRPGIM